MSTSPYSDTDTHRDIHSDAARHPVDVAQLVMGLVFLGLLATWGLVQTGVAEGAELRWLLPVPWLVAGGAGLLAVALRSRRSPRA